MPTKKRGSKANYHHYRQESPSEFKNNTFQTVPLNHTSYKGKKFQSWNKSGTGAKAVIARRKSNGEFGIQSILIPKKRPKKRKK